MSNFAKKNALNDDTRKESIALTLRVISLMLCFGGLCFLIGAFFLCSDTYVVPLFFFGLLLALLALCALLIGRFLLKISWRYSSSPSRIAFFVKWFIRVVLAGGGLLLITLAALSKLAK